MQNIVRRHLNRLNSKVKGISVLGWFLLGVALVFPFYLQFHPQLRCITNQIFCGIHLLTVIIFSYYFGFWGAVLIVLFGTFHHLQSDISFCQSFLKGLAIFCFRACFALIVGYNVGRMRKRESLLASYNKVLERKSITDYLTGLYNRQYFFEYVRDHFGHNSQAAFCILMIDIDDFKNYNDTFGHLAGDKLLVQMAKLLDYIITDKQILARYGGEEFVVVLPYFSKEEGIEKAEEIRKTVEQYPFKQREIEQDVNITVSIGVATYPDDGTDIVHIIQRADEMLYKAKRSSKNKVMFFEK